MTVLGADIEECFKRKILTDWLTVVKVASDRGASGVEPVFIVGSQFLVDSGLDQIAPFRDL